MENEIKAVVRLCAWHRKYFKTDKVISLDISIANSTNNKIKSEDIILSHGICPECRAKVMKELKIKRKRNRE